MFLLGAAPPFSLFVKPCKLKAYAVRKFFKQTNPFQICHVCHVFAPPPPAPPPPMKNIESFQNRHKFSYKSRSCQSSICKCGWAASRPRMLKTRIPSKLVMHVMCLEVWRAALPPHLFLNTFPTNPPPKKKKKNKKKQTKKKPLPQKLPQNLIISAVQTASLPYIRKTFRHTNPVEPSYLSCVCKSAGGGGGRLGDCAHRPPPHPSAFSS